MQLLSRPRSKAAIVPPPAFPSDPVISARQWFQPMPLRTLFAHMLARRQQKQALEEDRTGYDPSMMGLS